MHKYDNTGIHNMTQRMWFTNKKIQDYAVFMGTCHPQKLSTQNNYTYENKSICVARKQVVSWCCTNASIITSNIMKY